MNRAAFVLAGALVLCGCTPEKSDTQARRDVEYFQQARDKCLAEIARLEGHRPELTDVPHTPAGESEGQTQHMLIAYRLPDVAGPASYNEADCTVAPNSAAVVQRKH